MYGVVAPGVSWSPESMIPPPEASLILGASLAQLNKWDTHKQMPADIGTLHIGHPASLPVRKGSAQPAQQQKWPQG